jgi:hypothetical protein
MGDQFHHRAHEPGVAYRPGRCNCRGAVYISEQTQEKEVMTEDQLARATELKWKIERLSHLLSAIKAIQPPVLKRAEDHGYQHNLHHPLPQYVMHLWEAHHAAAIQFYETELASLQKQFSDL